MTFSGIMNDRKVTISQFYDLFRNYERQKGHNLVIMNDIVNDKKGHNFCERQNLMVYRDSLV